MFVAIVLIQGIMSLVTLTIIVSRSQREAMGSQVTRTISGIEGYFEQVVDEQSINADLLSGQAEIVDYTYFGLSNLLQHQLSVYRSSLRMSSIAVYRNPDEPFGWVGTNPQMLHNDPDNRRLALDGTENITISSDLTSATLTSYAPIEREGEVIGALALSRSLDETFVRQLQTFTETTIVLSVGEYTVAVDELRARTIRELAALGEEAPEHASIVPIEGFVVGTISPPAFEGQDVRVFALLDTEESRQVITRYNQISVTITIVTLSAALLLGFMFYRLSFKRPFHNLMQAAHRISEGDFEHAFAVPSDDEFGELAAAFNTMRRNLKSRERELIKLSLYNSFILDSVQTGIITVSPDRFITTFNAAATGILDLNAETVLNMKYDAGPLPAELVTVIRAALDDSIYSGNEEVTIHAEPNAGRTLTVSTAPLRSREGDEIGTIAVFEDVTRIRELERRLEISQRLAALGEMAAGVAHQIRNPLGIMKVSAQMLRDDFSVNEKPDTFDHITHMIVNEIETLNLVISNLLDFARPRPVELKPCSPREMVESAIEHLPLDSYTHVSVELIGFEEVPEHPMDRSLMEQVISNLVLNALQASGEDAVVHVRASMQQEKLCLEVHDWGEGFSETERAKLFNPFYTNKSGGTGLGLSIAHRIVEQHGGTIDVSSTPGRGTSFRIVF